MILSIRMKSVIPFIRNVIEAKNNTKIGDFPNLLAEEISRLQNFDEAQPENAVAGQS